MEKLPFHTDPTRKIQNALFFQALKASRELLGEDGFKAVIHRAEILCPGMGTYLEEGRWPPENERAETPARHYSALFQAIEEVGGGRAQLVKIGIETAKMGAAGLGVAMKAQLTILKRLPGFTWRAEAILKAVAEDLMSSIPGDLALNAIFVESDHEKKVIRLVDRTGDTCHERTGARTPVCHIYRGGIIGTIQQATGVIPSVKEVRCMACGDPACVFEIGMEPVGKNAHSP